MATVLLLSVLTVVYNNLINRWQPFHGSAYVPTNLLLALMVTVLAASALDLSAASLGLQGSPRDLLLPLVLVAAFATVAFAIARSRHAHRIADRRVAGMQRRALAFYVLVRIPLGTAVTEEVIFRGVLFATWQAAGTSDLGAALLASTAFGVWHIAPTVIGLRVNDPAASPAKVRAAVIGAVLATTIAGLGLTWLRVWSGSLLAPIVLHAGVNSVGALGAVIASRRKVRASSRPLE